jgi:hypothetical protein
MTPRVREASCEEVGREVGREGGKEGRRGGRVSSFGVSQT